MHEARHDSHYAPADHDPGHPLAGTPAFDKHRAWNFKQDVTHKENSGSEPENAIAEAQISTHAKIREGNVDTIDVADDVHEKHKRKEARGNSSARDLFQPVRFHATPRRFAEAYDGSRRYLSLFRDIHIAREPALSSELSGNRKKPLLILVGCIALDLA